MNFEAECHVPPGEPDNSTRREVMDEPIYRAGTWWLRRDDGRWLYWNVLSDHWDHHPYGPPVASRRTAADQVQPAPVGPSAFAVSHPAAPALTPQAHPSPGPGPPGPAGMPYPQQVPPPYEGAPTPHLSAPYGPRRAPAPKPAPSWAQGTAVVYAGWWQRVLALLIDLVVVTVPVLLVLEIVDAAVGPGTVDPFTGRVDSGARTAVRMWAFAACYFVFIPVYFALLQGGEQGATLGQRATKTRVADANDGSTIGFGRALLRWALMGVFWLFLYLPGVLNLLWPLWDPQRQSWHDKMVNSVVVTAPR